MQHINLVSPGRLPLSNVDSQGFFQPQASDYSDKYLAGYEQLDFPDPTSLFPGTYINSRYQMHDNIHVFLKVSTLTLSFFSGLLMISQFYKLFVSIFK